MKKQIWANPTAAPAIPVKPSIPDIMAIKVNVRVQRNIINCFNF